MKDFRNANYPVVCIRDVCFVSNRSSNQTDLSKIKLKNINMNVNVDNLKKLVPDLINSLWIKPEDELFSGMVVLRGSNIVLFSFFLSLFLCLQLLALLFLLASLLYGFL